MIYYALPTETHQFVGQELFPEAVLMLQYKAEYTSDEYWFNGRVHTDYYKLKPYYIIDHNFRGESYSCTIWSVLHSHGHV